jgi:hypothetical protein
MGYLSIIRNMEPPAGVGRLRQVPTRPEPATVPGMRHLVTLIAAAAIAPLAWVLLAFGQDRSAQAFINAQDAGAFNTDDFLRPTLCLAAAGILFGLIGTLRFSPLGAVATGILYAASYLILLIDPQGWLDLLPKTLTFAGKQADPITPIRSGSTLILGALLLVAVVSVGRWRRWPDREQAVGPVAEEMELALPGREHPLVGTDGYGPALPAWIAEPEVPARQPAQHMPAAGVSNWVSSLRTDPDRPVRIPTRLARGGSRW